LASRHSGRAVGGLEDLGLNGMTPRAFRSHVRSSQLRVESIAYNSGDQRLLPAMSALRRLPALEALMTVSIYAVLRKDSRQRPTAAPAAPDRSQEPENPLPTPGETA
jgi:hypothetical protein